MKKSIKYVYDDILYAVLKKHFCPICGSKLKFSYMSKIVNSDSPQSAEYDFSLADNYLVGEIEFRKRCFYCPKCDLKISFNDDVKKFEHDM